jgi:enamine deaminase RidA (YjgF/YER057c/UK114 family)
VKLTRRPAPVKAGAGLPWRAEFLAEGIFGQRGPASTMIQVAALAHPDYLIEIEAIAIV